MRVLPITGSSALDTLCFIAIGYTGAILLYPLVQWIDYRRDCKKYGKETADEIRRRWR